MWLAVCVFVLFQVGCSDSYRYFNRLSQDTLQGNFLTKVYSIKFGHNRNYTVQTFKGRRWIRLAKRANQAKCSPKKSYNPDFTCTDIMAKFWDTVLQWGLTQITMHDDDTEILPR